MLKQKIKTIFEALLYIMLTYWLIDSFFAFNKYDWMLESGGNICSIPSVSGGDRILQAMIAAFFLLTPLIILILRKLFMREMFEFWGNDSNLLIVFYVQIMPDDLVMQLHRF
ncbi:DUF2645 family protein [Escherichia coli]|nr:DUF2645 family protein [Escherichia coli]